MKAALDNHLDLAFPRAKLMAPENPLRDLGLPQELLSRWRQTVKNLTEPALKRRWEKQ